MGKIFDIQRFCLHDGPGIRTTVFLKGCPLRCAWCHNPESWRATVEIFFTPRLCVNCGACANCPTGSARDYLAHRPHAEDICAGCLQCARACPSGAIEQCGRDASAAEAIGIVLRDKVFYEHSGGGLTLSGGEPALQVKFAGELLRLAREAGLHVCIETSGAAPWGHYAALLPWVDLFLWDIKDTNSARHERLTGVPPEPLIENLKRLDAAGGRTVLRCLVIDGVNADEAHIEALAGLYKGLKNALAVELLPYHPLGQSKDARLNRQSSTAFARPSPERMTAFCALLARHGVPVLEPAP